MNNKRVILLTGIVFLFFAGYQFVKKKKEVQTRHFLLAHNIAPEHPVHHGMVKFAEEVSRLSDGRISVTIYPSGQLGTEKDVLELVQLGAITMTKVSSLSLESFSPLLGVLNLPFIFQSREHYFKVLDSWIGDELKEAPIPQRLRGLIYFDAGDRNFYASKPILTPKDVVGLKIRVMENATAIRMLKLLGGSPTPMPYGEVYTALQQGVIDGAENNITAITVNRHGEVSKHYSRDQHIFAPDILMISGQVYLDLSDEDRAIVHEASTTARDFQRNLWEEQNIIYEKEAAEKMGVKFYDVDKSLFREKVDVLHDEYSKKGPHFSRLIQSIKEMN